MEVSVNYVSLYYEGCGVGKPIIFLHGNGEDHRIFDGCQKQLCHRYSVYLVDSRNHGQSEHGLPISYDLMCEDVRRMIEQLQLDKPIIIGFSDGGIVALLLAIRYPHLVQKLILCGVNTSPNGLKPLCRVRLAMQYLLYRSPLIKMMLTEPHITTRQLESINVPVFLFQGEYDAIRRRHAQRIANRIQTSSLRILKDQTHDSYVFDSNIFTKLIQGVLNDRSL